MSDQTVFALVAVPAVLFHLTLLAHFALRRWAFDTALRWGWIVYALSIPAAAVSIVLLRAGVWWAYWVSGLLYLAWATFGFMIEYVLRIEWRNARRWPIFVSYVLLYMSTCMFYWWPPRLLSQGLWLLLGALFMASTVLNVTSHRRPAERGAEAQHR